MVEEIILQEHTYHLTKLPDVGFGIAISGGRDNPGVETRDPSIIISDVVKQGPAFNKLQINDTVVCVNGMLTYGMSHQQAVHQLKNAGKSVEITVKRKALVRVDRRRDTPSPGSLRRARSRDFDSRGRHRSRSRDYSPYRHRSHSRDLDRSRSKPRHYSDRDYSRSRSRTPPRRRGRSYSRSHSRSSRNKKLSVSPSSSSRSRSPPRHRSRSRGRSRTPERYRARSRSPTPSSRSASPVRTPKKHRSVGDLRSMSPLSPDPHDAKQTDDMMVFPVKPSEPKPVVLKKTRWNNSYGLKLGTRIFIQDIQPGSLAEKNPELRAGDTILMINGRNVDNKSVQEAIQIIGLSKDKLTMVVKKEEGGTVSIPAARFASQASPKTSQDPKSKHTGRDGSSTHSRSHHSSPSRESVHSGASKRSTEKQVDDFPDPEPKADVKPSKKTIGGIRVMPAELSAAAANAKRSDSPSSGSVNSGSHRSFTPEPAPRATKSGTLSNSKQPVYDLPPDGEDQILPHDSRTIRFIKGRNVGIRLAGGNDVGIFVASVQDGSPAAKQGLQAGDQILSVNDTNFRNIIREEAVLTLMGLPNDQEVKIVAQPRPDAYNNILEHGTGDSFYIRTHFKYERANAHEMSFKQGSIFRVSDTLYQGMVGYWLAVRIGRTNMEIERGVIPNGSRAQQLKEVQDKKIQQAKEKASTRGGIGRRLKPGSKAKVDTKSSNSPHFPAYERVVLREAGFKRPVVVFGPLADIARQRLASDYPNNYQIASNEGMVSGQKSNRKGIIRLNTIKDIIEKDKHAILDITPTAVEKLNYAQLYPIVVFLKPESKAAVKDLRNKLAITEDEKRKKPGKLYDRAVKMQKGYSHVCTDIIPLSSVSDDWYRKLSSTIKDQQNMPVWVSEDKLGGTAEEDTEGVMIPGDDDRLSYVSAPASDYSVTTVGSDMLHSTTDFEDNEFPEKNIDSLMDNKLSSALMPPPRKRQSSSSSSEDDAGNKFDDDDLDDALNTELDDGPPSSKPDPPVKYTEDDDRDMPAAPPRGKKQSIPLDHPDDTSSTSSEGKRLVGARPTPMIPAEATRNQETPRTLGKQSIPEGRFDPQSFLQNHIKRLKQVKSADPIHQQEQASPLHEERVSEPTPTSTLHSAPNMQKPPKEMDNLNRADASTREPVYAQVNKKRPGPQTTPHMPADTERDHGEFPGRDYAGEIDSFISPSGAQRRDGRPTGNRPVRDEPVQQVQAPVESSFAQNSYRRFGGGNKPAQFQNQYQPYSSNKPTGYGNSSSADLPSGGGGHNDPSKSRYPPDNYKNYMQQRRHPESKPASYSPRPFNKSNVPPNMATQFKNGPVKDQMYDSGVEAYDSAKPKLNQPEPVPVSPTSIEDDDPQVVATARGVFDSNGGVLSSVETGVSIMIPKGAIQPGVKQEIYFKVCKDNTVLPPLDKDKGETLLSPLVMCGPHGLQFNHPVELRLPHCEPTQWQDMNAPQDSNYQVSSNSVSVLIDHF